MELVQLCNWIIGGLETLVERGGIAEAEFRVKLLAVPNNIIDCLMSSLALFMALLIFNSVTVVHLDNSL